MSRPEALAAAATAVRLRPARGADIPSLLALINGYAHRNLLLPRTEASLRAHLADFLVADDSGTVVGCVALAPLGPRLGEVRSLAVAEAWSGRGLGRALVEQAVAGAADRGFAEVLALTRRVSFFEALGFAVTQRERYLDKLAVDCHTCPMNLCCDETALVIAVNPPAGRRAVHHQGAP